MIFFAVNHEEEVKDSEEDVHCVEDSVRANVVLQLIDEDEGSALEEEVEDDGGVEQGLFGEGQQVPPPPDWITCGCFSFISMFVSSLYLTCAGHFFNFSY